MTEMDVEQFIENQRRTAKGARLERLNGDLTGEKKLLTAILWPVLKSFDGITLEYEIVSSSGIKIYMDAFYHPLGIAFESDGFAVHAESITRDRFAFERMRIRTLALYKYKYVPFTWDEMDKKPELCRRYVYELLGRFTGTSDMAYRDLTIYEREILRYGLGLNRPLKLADICYCLGIGNGPSRKVLRSLIGKDLITPVSAGKLRNHAYVLGDKAAAYML